MKLLIMVLAIFISCSIAQAKDIQLFDPSFFGQPTSSSIKLLFDKKADELEPYMVMTDIKCGKYNAASAFYSNKVTFKQARESLNKLYKNYENLKLYKESAQALWRVTDKQFAVHLVQEEDKIRIMYLQFQPTKEVFKNMLNTQGDNTNALDEDECN